MRSRWGMVEQCSDCYKFQTTLMDYSKGELVTLPGNLLAATLNRIYVLCGNEEEFKQGMGILKAGNWQSFEYIHYLQSIEQLIAVKNPVIYLYGTWWENDLCQSPVVTRALNGWL
jgi:hypothetical protein